MNTTELNTRKAAAYLKRSIGGIKKPVGQGRLIGRLEHPRYRVFTIEELEAWDIKWPKGARKEVK